MKNEEKLKEELHRTRNALDKIEGERQRKANRKNLGKCFKYENSYGTGDKWPLYLRIRKAGQIMEGHQFEKTSTGRFETHRNTYVSNLDSYTEIPLSEFQTAWQKFVRELKALLNG